MCYFKDEPSKPIVLTGGKILCDYWSSRYRPGNTEDSLKEITKLRSKNITKGKYRIYV